MSYSHNMASRQRRVSAESIAQTFMDMDSGDDDFNSPEEESMSDSHSERDSDSNEPRYHSFQGGGRSRGQGRSQSRGRGQVLGRGDIPDHRSSTSQGRIRGHDSRPISQGQHVIDTKWKTTNEAFDVPMFSGEERINVSDDFEIPKDYFELFIDNVFLDLMTKETNRYADQFMASVNNELSEHTRVRK